MVDQGNPGLERYESLTDEKLVKLSNEGDIDATESVMRRYRWLVVSRARDYFLHGAEHDDVLQEGMIGLYKAIRSFRPVESATFRTYAELCVRRQIISAIRSALRNKHAPLNDSVCIEDQEIVSAVVEVRGLSEQIAPNLSPRESKVLNAFLEGKSYVEISAELDITTKSVDNSMQRIKRKMQRDQN